MALEQWKQRFEKPLQLVRRWRYYASEQLVGLDIGSGSIKLLKINTDANPYQVENFGIVSLPPNVVLKHEIKDANVLGLALKEVFEKARVKTKNVALAIPRSSTIIKTINVDKRLNAADIESRAWVEANHHFPDLVGDIYLDFDLVGPSSQDPSQLELLLVACRKDHVQPYLDVLRDNGLTAAIVDVDCYAFERALTLIAKKHKHLKTLALLNLDFNVSSLIVIHEGQLIYSHDHGFEGFHFNEQVEQYFKDKKKSKGDLSDLAYADILKAGLSAHLRHSMHFFYSSRPHINIQKLLLAGDCAALPALDAFVQQETKVETSLADPCRAMLSSSSIDEPKLQQYSSALMLCCGLALSRPKEMES